MKWIFTVIVSVILVGGGLLIVLSLDENSKRFSHYVHLLFFLSGIIIAIFGVVFQTTGQIFPSSRGPVEGWQLIIVGILLTAFSGWAIIKKQKI